MPSLDHPSMPSPVRSISFPADGPSPRKLKVLQPTDGYFSENHSQSPIRPSPLRPALRVRFDHLLASETPPSEDIHPNEMYSRDRVTTPHPAQRILFRSTPPSRSSSWSETPFGTPNMMGVKSPPTPASSASTESKEPGKRPQTPHPKAARLLMRGSMSMARDEDGDVEMNEANSNTDIDMGALYQTSPVLARNLNIRGNSWVFDEAERLSMERARGLRIVELSSDQNEKSIEEQMKGKRNGSERSLRSLLSMSVASPTEEDAQNRQREERVLSPPAKHADRGRTYALYEQRQGQMKEFGSRTMVLRTHSSVS